MNQAVEKFLENLKVEIDTFINTYEYDALEKASQLIIDSQNNHGRAHVSGIGKPSHVSSYIASLFSSIGIPTYFLDATEATHGSAGQVQAGDIVIVISNSGKTKELLFTVETLKNNKAKIIGVTRDKASPLALLSDVVLVAKVDNEGDNLNKPPRASVINEMILLQMLSILLQSHHNLDMKTYLKWHPGGSIGESKI